MTAVPGNTSRKSLVIATDLSSTQTDNLFYSTSIEMDTTTSLIISSNSVKQTSDIFTSHDETSTTTEHSSQLTVYQCSFCVTHTNYSNSNDNNTPQLILGLVGLSIVMCVLGGVLDGLLTVLCNKRRKRKGRAVVALLLLFNLW